MKWNRNEIAQFIGLIGIACLVAGYLRYLDSRMNCLLTSQDSADHRRSPHLGRRGDRISGVSRVFLQAFLAAGHQHHRSVARRTGHPGGLEFSGLPPFTSAST